MLLMLSSFYDDDSVDVDLMPIHLMAVGFLVCVTTYLDHDRPDRDLNHYLDSDLNPFHHRHKCQPMNDHVNL